MQKNKLPCEKTTLISGSSAKSVTFNIWHKDGIVTV